MACSNSALTTAIIVQPKVPTKGSERANVPRTPAADRLAPTGSSSWAQPVAALRRFSSVDAYESFKKKDVPLLAWISDQPLTFLVLCGILLDWLPHFLGLSSTLAQSGTRLVVLPLVLLDVVRHPARYVGNIYGLIVLSL